MKLHLPKSLLAAVMACTATFSGLSSTIGTGLITGGAMTIAFVGQEALAEVVTVTSNTPIDWNSADLSADGYIVGTAENKATLTIGKENGPAEANNEIGVGPITVVNGQLTLHAWTGTVRTLAQVDDNGNYNKVKLTNGIELKNGTTFRIEDGSYYFPSISVSGEATIHSQCDKNYDIASLTGDSSSVLKLHRGSWGNYSVFNLLNENDFAGTIRVSNASGYDSTANAVVLSHQNALRDAAIDFNADIRADGVEKNQLALNVSAATIRALTGTGRVILASKIANNTDYDSAVTASTLTITNATGTFSGTIAEGVTLNITGGSQILSGVTLGNTIQVGTGAALTLSGSITLADSLVVRNASESAENGFASASATVANGTGIIDATDVTWYAQGSEKQGTLTNGVVTFTSSIYDIKKADSVVSSTDAATAGAVGYYITGSGSTLTLKNVEEPADLPYGVVVNVGNAGKATVVISEGCDWTAAYADTILDKQSGSYELTVKDGANLSFAVYKDLGTNVINVADGGVLQLSGSSWGAAHFRGDINVGGDGTLVLSAGDSLGWSGAAPTKTINLKGESSEKIAVVQVTGKQTLSTNINLSGNTHIQDAGSGQFELFGGKISASGTNNIIDVDIKTCQTGEFAVDENASLTLNGDIIMGQPLNGASHTINKTGKGELQLKGSTIYGTFNLKEGSLALLNNMTLEEGSSLNASSGTSLQLGASIINKGTVNIFDSALSIDSYGHFKQYGEGEGTITFSRDGTDGFESITGLEYYLIEGSGGKITGAKPTQIGNYSIKCNDNGDAIISGGSFVTGNIYQVNTKDITLTADEISHATGYVVADGKAATVTGAKGDITTVSLGAESTLNIGGAANEPLSIKNSFTAAGKGYLNVTGGDVILGTSISGANANVELGVTGGSLTINSCNAKITKTTVAADATLILNASYSNSSASIVGEATVYGTMVLATGDVTGWDGNSGCLTKINLGDEETAGGILQIDTIGGDGNNQTLGKTVINMYGGTIVGKATSTLDLFKGGSAINVYSVNGTAEAPTESTITLGLLGVRQDDTKFMVAENARLIVNAVIDDGSGNNNEGDNKLIKLGAGEMVLSMANTYTGGTEVQNGTLVAATGAALGTGDVTISGGKLEITDAGGGAKVEVAKLAGQNSASIKNNGENGVEGSIFGTNYGIGYTNYTIENAQVAVTSDKAVTISNQLKNVALTNSGTGTITAGNGYNYYTDIEAISGDISLLGIGNANNKNTQEALNSLVISEGRKVEARSNWNVGIDAISNKATLTVAGAATFGKNATLNANLTLGGGITPVTLTLDGVGSNAVKIGGDLVLPESGTLLTLRGDVLNSIASLRAGEQLEIFGVKGGFFVGETKYSEALTASNGIILDTIFSSEDINLENYYLGFYNIPDEAGYSTVYIGMIVPEPTTATLSLLALAALAARRRRR